MSLFNTVRFLEFVLDLGTVKRPVVFSHAGGMCGGMCGGESVCVRAVCKLTM